MLSASDLQIADILLSTGAASSSAVIRAGTGSRYSHSALFIGDGQIVEAISQGVVKQTLEAAMDDDTLVGVYRRLEMHPTQAQRVVQYVLQQIGKAYDHSGAAGSGIACPRGIVIGIFLSPIVVYGGIGADLYNRANPEAAFFCSELVALAFRHARVPLGSLAASTTPGDIARSHVLNFVGHLKGG